MKSSLQIYYVLHISTTTPQREQTLCNRLRDVYWGSDPAMRRDARMHARACAGKRRVYPALLMGAAMARICQLLAAEAKMIHLDLRWLAVGRRYQGQHAYLWTQGKCAGNVQLLSTDIIFVQLSNSGREHRAPMSWESIAASREVWGAPLGGFRSIRDGGESRKGRGGHGKACRVSLGRFWLTRQTAVVDGGVERSGVHPLGGVNDAENAERRAVSHPAVVG